MPRHPPRFRVHISGPLALFTRPEMKVERVSYDVMTPSAARAILEAILWKPQMRWVVKRITVLNPIRFVSFKRNEVASKVPGRAAVSWAKAGRPDRDFFADDDRQRQQRNSVVLRDVAYVVEASIGLSDRAGPEDNLVKYAEMFRRRVEAGQHFHQPCLGCREFPADIRLAGEEDSPDESLLGEYDLGWMLLDLVWDYEGGDYRRGRAREARFFHAVLRDGVVEVPRLEEVAA